MSKKTKVNNQASSSVISNGLTDALLGTAGVGVQLSQGDTIIKNMRYYLISNLRNVLSQAYVEIGIIKTVVDVPVDDAMRGGVEIKSKELSPDEIEDLQFLIEQNDDITAIADSLKWDRLFGGAGILIESGQDWETPLDIKSISVGDPLSFKAVDMWELFFDMSNISGDGSPIDSPARDFYSYYGKKIHKSRVMITKGIKPPSVLRPKLRGWGLSVVEVLIRSINQFLKATDVTFEVLDQFKIDIYKIKNLTNTLLSNDGVTKIQQRVQLANQQKNFQNAVTMDSEDDYIQKELSFGGISETMAGIRMQIASDLRMPMSKVFGISAQGFDSGETDIETYNSMVESTIRSKCKHHVIRLIKLRCQQQFGYVPDDIQVEFKPLRILSSEQEESVKSQKFARILQALTAGVITPKEFKDACNKENLLSIQLDATQDTLLDTKKSDDEEVKEAPKAKPSALAAKPAPEAKV